MFSKLDSSESMATDDIKANLSFVEHNPPIVRQEQAIARVASPGELAQKIAEKAIKKGDEAVNQAIQKPEAVIGGSLD